MKKNNDREFWESGIDNNATFLQYFRRIIDIAISRFIWKLPKTVDTRFLELCLLTDGRAILFKDEELGWIALRCMPHGRFNIYRVPTEREAYADNGYHKMLNEENSVIIYNNRSRTNSILDIKYYAKRLYNIDRIIDVNVNVQKTPILITCNKQEQLSLENLYMKYDGNQPVIFGSKELSPDTLKVMSTGAPYVADNLYKLKTNLWNELMTFLGFATVPMKKERLNVAEVQRNLGGTYACRQSPLLARIDSCEEAKELFPELAEFGIDVKFNDGIPDDYIEETNGTDMGVGDLNV